MTIIFKIDNLLLELFPRLKGSSEDKDQLINYIKEFYTIEGVSPQVDYDGEYLTIKIDHEGIEFERNEFMRIIKLCEQGKFQPAQKRIEKLINNNPQQSEYHRVYGQILSETGNQKEAINSLVEALRWNPANTSALIMLGNIYVREEQDSETALTFYQKAIEHDPENHIALTNIGANLMKIDQKNKAMQFFNRSLNVNNKYPNTYLGLSMAHMQDKEYYKAFSQAIEGIKNTSRNDPVLKQLLQGAIEAGRNLSGSKDIIDSVNEYKEQLANKAGKTIRFEEDNSITTTAKLEIAEVHHRDSHIVRYKPNKTGYQHLIMHELTHLNFILKARESGVNQQFGYSEKHKSQFFKDHNKFIRKMSNKKFPEKSIRSFLNSAFDGLNLQLYNTPIDLFIEDFLYNNFEHIRPLQFLSLYEEYLQGIKAVTDKKIVQMAPSSIIKPSRILNMVLSHQFRDLFGLDLLMEYNATRVEEREAKELYDEYLEYRLVPEPGEEYELIKNWGEDLKLENYFSLVEEKKTQDNTTTAENVLDQVEADPFGVYSDEKFKKEESKKFLEAHKSKELNMAVVMYMVEALERFNSQPKAEVKNVALEIAMLGTQGINPDKEGYKLQSIPDKSFTGYHLLAYYYVTWALAIPEKVDGLQMPFEKEYETAKQISKLSNRNE